MWFPSLDQNPRNKLYSVGRTLPGPSQNSYESRAKTDFCAHMCVCLAVLYALCVTSVGNGEEHSERRLCPTPSDDSRNEKTTESPLDSLYEVWVSLQPRCRSSPNTQVLREWERLPMTRGEDDPTMIPE